MRAQAAFVGIVSLIAFAGCKKGDDAGAGSAKTASASIKVATFVATEAPAPDVLTLTGTIAADQRSDVTADTQGKVVNVMIERGQHVKLGQVVIQLDVRGAALSQREAQANLEAARAQKALAEEECKRTKSLLDKGAITQSDFDKQSEQCTTSLHQVAAAQARSEMMAKSVSDGLVRAPFDGLVSERMVSPGEWVAPGKALFTLVKDDPLKIELSVPEVAVRSVREGERVELQAVAQPDKKYQASIKRIAAEIGRTRSLIVEAQLDKDSGLVPGMFAEAHVVIGQTPHVVVPKSAVAYRHKQWHAFVVKNGEAEDHIVQIGVSPAEGQVTILKGIDKDQQLIAQVTDEVVDGVKVESTGGASPAPAAPAPPAPAPSAPEKK
jgi:membrane fusion protein (multidrug efflux system)